LRGSALKVERVGCRVRTEAEEEVVGDGAEAAKGVNNEGYQKGVALIQCTNYHFAIYKSTGGADTRTTKFCLFCFLKVFGDRNHIGGITNRLRRKGTCGMDINSSFCKG
jgi:hypothetical protein